RLRHGAGGRTRPAGRIGGDVRSVSPAAAVGERSRPGAAARRDGCVERDRGGGRAELAGWRALFWLDLPLAGAMAAGVLARVERDEAGVAARLDLPGAAL